MNHANSLAIHSLRRQNCSCEHMQKEKIFHKTFQIHNHYKCHLGEYTCNSKVVFEVPSTFHSNAANHSTYFPFVLLNILSIQSSALNVMTIPCTHFQSNYENSHSLQHKMHHLQIQSLSLIILKSYQS